MKMKLEAIAQSGIIPVIKIESLEYAKPLAWALREGGINTIEVTVRNNVAFDAIKAIRGAFPDMHVGAGTILTVQLVDQALEAGAEYIVTPGFDKEVIQYCISREIPVIPGCVTPTEIGMAYAMGLRTVKFFPAETNGGISAIKLLAGPFGGMRFVPTGGINFENLGKYLREDMIAACGGSFMAPANLIREKNWKQITENCRRALNISLGFELAHVGLNHDNEDQAASNAQNLSEMLGLTVKNGNSSLFCDKAVEFMKFNYYGQKGHIGFYTNSVDRAAAWLRDRGICLREDSFRYDDKGSPVSFYLEEEVGGFAIHLVRR